MNLSKPMRSEELTERQREASWPGESRAQAALESVASRNRSDMVAHALAVLPRGRFSQGFSVLPSLSQALERVDNVFSIAKILQDEGLDRVSKYYSASGFGYRLVHSREGCMHLALSEGSEFKKSDFLAQLRAVEQVVKNTGARRVLELGSGQGFNLRHLAANCPGVDFIGLDILPAHVRRARKAAVGLRNLDFRQGSFDQLPSDLSGFDLIFSIESLCHAHDMETVAREVFHALEPDGVFILFDAVRSRPLAEMEPEMVTAIRLYEIVTAVSKGFRMQSELVDAFDEGGLLPACLIDLTEAVVPGVRRLYGYGQRYFNALNIRLFSLPLPAALRRNAAAALLGPYLVEGFQPGTSIARSCGLQYVCMGFTRPTGRTTRSVSPQVHQQNR